MEESQFLAITDQIFDQIMSALDDSGEDIECLLSGNVLDIECENGSKIIVNRHTPNQEIWIAAKSGGFHFKLKNEKWMDSRSDDEFFASLKRVLKEQTGVDFTIE
ncbi:iron donor protein CyaY [Leeia sp. TBRC 13508]|uniref:Iron-sulfur cluster assembly protein CyaY n=1 Tax=Leeia speluncae TaxID=2884804 RepID=A0ABS8D7G9_9NEIS|nr:iron donor protein CyaY [Leeia speluncae]MCB6184092.1 iron donor protein CyaY [Leeia speluncae]